MKLFIFPTFLLMTIVATEQGRLLVYKDASSGRIDVHPRARAILQGDLQKYHHFDYPEIPECKDPTQIPEVGPGLSSPTSIKIYRFDPSLDPMYAVQITMFETKTSCSLNFVGMSTLKEIWEVSASVKDHLTGTWLEDVKQSAKELLQSGTLGQIITNDNGVEKYNCCWMRTCVQIRKVVRLKLIRVHWGSAGHIVDPFFDKSCRVDKGPLIYNCTVTKATTLFWSPLKTEVHDCRIKEIATAPGVIRATRTLSAVTGVSFTSADFRINLGLHSGNVEDMKPECETERKDLVFFTEAGVLYSFAGHQGYPILAYWVDPDHPEVWTKKMESRLVDSEIHVPDKNIPVEPGRIKRSSNHMGNDSSKVKRRSSPSTKAKGTTLRPTLSFDNNALRAPGFLPPVDSRSLIVEDEVQTQLVFSRPPSRGKRSAIDNLPLDVEINALAERVSWTHAQLVYQLNSLANKTAQQLEYALYQACQNRRNLLYLAEVLLPINERPLIYHYLRHDGFLSAYRGRKIYVNVGVIIEKIYLGAEPSFCDDKLWVSFEGAGLGIRRGLMVNRRGLVLEEGPQTETWGNCSRKESPSHFYIPLIDGDVYDVVGHRLLSTPLMNTSVQNLMNWEVNSFPTYELKDMNYVNQLAEDGMNQFLPNHKGKISDDSIWRTLESEMKVPSFFKEIWHYLLIGALILFIVPSILVCVAACCTRVVRESIKLGFS